MRDMIIYKTSMKFLLRQNLQLLTYKELDRGPQMQSSPLPMKYKNTRIGKSYFFMCRKWSSSFQDEFKSKRTKSLMRLWKVAWMKMDYLLGRSPSF